MPESVPAPGQDNPQEAMARLSLALMAEQKRAEAAGEVPSVSRAIESLQDPAPVSLCDPDQPSGASPVGNDGETGAGHNPQEGCPGCEVCELALELIQVREALEASLVKVSCSHPTGQGTNCGECNDCLKVNYHFTRRALEAVTREREEWKALFASLEPSPDGGYGPDGAPAWKDAYIARMWEGIEAQSRANAAERELAETTETFRLIAQAAGEDGCDSDDWRAMVFPSPGEYALRAVRQLRDDSESRNTQTHSKLSETGE